MNTSPSVSGFHHVALRSKNFDRSVDFYTRVLGLKPAMTWGEAPQRAIMLDAGGRCYVEIFERPSEPDAPEVSGILLHFALRTSDTDALLEKVRAEGFTVTVEPKTVDVQNTNPDLPATIPVRIAFFNGPDGESVELFQSEGI